MSDDRKPIKLPPAYKHNPKLEPRPYWSVDRFLSSLTGIVHYFSLPTSEPFRHMNQLTQKWEPTEADRKAQKSRDDEHKAYVARVRQNQSEARQTEAAQLVRQGKKARGTISSKPMAKADPMPIRRAETMASPKPEAKAASKASKIKMAGRRPPPKKARRPNQ